MQFLSLYSPKPRLSHGNKWDASGSPVSEGHTPDRAMHDSPSKLHALPSEHGAY